MTREMRDQKWRKLKLQRPKVEEYEVTGTQFIQILLTWLNDGLKIKEYEITKTKSFFFAGTKTEIY